MFKAPAVTILSSRDMREINGKRETNNITELIDNGYTDMQKIPPIVVDCISATSPQEK